MELGQRLKQVRLEMGLSQRQLCEDIITRNMLSQIENGSARPSMDALRKLAARLEKPMSFFLEEDVILSSNQTVMEAVREAFTQKEHADALRILEDYRTPDGVFDMERYFLEAMSCLALARQALNEGRRPYAVQLLQRCAQAGQNTAYYDKALEEERCLLLAQAQPETAEMLPSLDEALILRAKHALSKGDGARSARLLDATEDQTDPRWCLLRGEVAFAMGQYPEAVTFLTQAEAAFPGKTAALLENCYRELEDYKMAYFYACKQKEAP